MPSAHKLSYAASVASSTGSTTDGSSFSGLLTRVEIGYVRIGSAENGASPSQQVQSAGARITGIRS
jgi:hypothetical protein